MVLWGVPVYWDCSGLFCIVLDCSGLFQVVPDYAPYSVFYKNLDGLRAGGWERYDICQVS